MKIIKLSCDFCCEEIEEEDKYHVLNVPVHVDFSGDKIIRKEHHFCERCYSWRIDSSLTEYQIDTEKHISKYLSENKWRMKYQ